MIPTIAIPPAQFLTSPTDDLLPGQMPSSDQSRALMETAKKFEATFLAEMLKHTGMGQTRESFGGGPGEAAFSEFLTREYAAKMSETGAIGLADRVYDVLVERSRT